MKIVHTQAGWRIVAMDGFRISHPFMAVAPGCPDGRHPTRDCGCTVFKTTKAAIEHIVTESKKEAQAS